MNEEIGDQVSTGLPIEQFDPSIVVQPLVLDERGKTEQLMVTVSTSNGRTRRKHHRPWTLREVMTLVEGVARCGGGKWADIKKLAFSTIGYRTAVDLKVLFLVDFATCIFGCHFFISNIFNEVNYSHKIWDNCTKWYTYVSIAFVDFGIFGPFKLNTR